MKKLLSLLIFTVLTVVCSFGQSATVVEISPHLGQPIQLSAEGKASFSISFSAPVTINRQGTYVLLGISMSDFSPIRGEMSYESTDADNRIWVFTIDETVVQEAVNAYDELRVNISARGPNNQSVSFNGMTPITLNYKTELLQQKGAAFQTNLEDATIEAPVSEFSVYSDTPGMSANCFVLSDEEGNQINPYTSIKVSGIDNDFVAYAQPLAEIDGEQVPFDGKITLTEPITEAGEYQVYFPYRAFNIIISNGDVGGSGAEGDVTEFSEEKTVTFTVTAKEQEPVSLMSPANIISPSGVNGATSTYFDIFTISWNFTPFEFTDEPLSALISINGEERGIIPANRFRAGASFGEPKEGEPEPSLPEGWYNSLRIEFYDFIKVYDIEGGVYEITIPQGIVQNAVGAVNPAQTFTFNIIPTIPYDVIPVSDPEAVNPNIGDYTPLGELDQIFVSWPGYDISGIIKNNNCRLIINGRDENNDPIEEHINVYPVVNNNALEFSVGDYVRKSGVYTLNISEMTAEFTGGYTNNPCQLEYIVVLGTDVVSDTFIPLQDRFVVYDLNGILIMDTDNITDIDNILSGIYIINGKKVIVNR